MAVARLNPTMFEQRLKKGVKVSIIVHDLHANPVSRAAPFAWALQKLGFSVEVLGMLPKNREVYEPYASEFLFKPLEVHGRISRHALELARMVSGDIVYAFKPFRTTLLPAMLASHFGVSKPVLLDIEDDDLGLCELTFLQRCFRCAGNGLKNPPSLLTDLTHLMRWRCSGNTVSTHHMQKFYGGTILQNGPHEGVYNPEKIIVPKADLRSQFGLPLGRPLVLFAGGPAFHKGFDLIVNAVDAEPNVDLVLAGDSTRDAFISAKARLGGRCHVLGFIAHSELPKLLHAIDIVPIPQRDVPYGRAQLPTKLLDAMAMEKSVIATQVGELPLIISGTHNAPRGWLVPPDDVRELRKAIRAIMENPTECQTRGKRARAYFLENSSVAANSRRFEKMFNTSNRLRPYLRAVSAL